MKQNTFHFYSLIRTTLKLVRLIWEVRCGTENVQCG